MHSNFEWRAVLRDGNCASTYLATGHPTLLFDDNKVCTEPFRITHTLLCNHVSPVFTVPAVKSYYEISFNATFNNAGR